MTSVQGEKWARGCSAGDAVLHEASVQGLVEHLNGHRLTQDGVASVMFTNGDGTQVT